MKEVVIIGSGIGGLSTGAVLAQNGYHVTILEQSSQIGGCLQCFSRGGVRFETGMHIVGSLDEGQILSNYFNALGIKDKLTFSRLDTNAYHIVSIGGKRFQFASGRQNFITQLVQQFPHQKENLQCYWNLVDSVAKSTQYYSIKNSSVADAPNVDLFTKSLNQIINNTISDPLLRQVLVGDMPLYAAVKDVTSFATHAYVADFYNSSSFRVVGGSDTITQALVQVIKQHGGTIINNSRVVQSHCDQGNVVYVTDTNNRKYFADIFVSDIHPYQMLDVFSDANFRPQYCQRVRSLKNTTATFALFLKFKDKTMRYMNSNFFSYRSSPWDLTNYTDANWPNGYFYMHHCHEINPSYARSGVVLACMSAEETAQWNNSTIGHRGADYEAFKKHKAEQLLDVMMSDFPDIRQCVDCYYTATPLTYRDYTLSPGGSIYGILKDINLGAQGHLSYRTKLHNLLLVGQNISNHGILGVLVGSFNVCGHILGSEVIERIMQQSNQATNAFDSSSTGYMPKLCSMLSRENGICDAKNIKPTSTIVIGGGVGGLFTSAILSKQGHKVTLIEKNNTLGGGLQSFCRKGIRYATGMHVFGGFKPGWQLDQLCRYLGIIDKVGVVPTDSDCFDEVIIIDGDVHYKMPKGRENYIRYLSSIFPHEAEGIRNYVDACYKLSREVRYFYFQPASKPSEQFFWPADKLISNYVGDTKLQRLLSYLAPLNAGIQGETPAFEHALINVLHIEGSAMFSHGGQSMTDALEQVIVDYGGTVVTNDSVSHIEVSNQMVSYVTTQSGKSYKADNYVSSIDPCELLNIITPDAFPISFKKRIKEAPYGYSAFKLYLHLKPCSIKHHNHPRFCVNSGDCSAWNLEEISIDAWPQCFMVMTQEDPNNPSYAETLTALIPISYHWFEPWVDTYSGHRGDEYQCFMNRLKSKAMVALTRLYHNLPDIILDSYTSSPLTIRDNYGTHNGSMFGFHNDCNHLLYTILPVNTKVRNLYLTGQNVVHHGLCGVALAAIATSETILGRNSVISQLKPIQCM
ncbi:MAG: NAD(P)/FAD-dependent oxidoreductase [Bacteroidales bacterium]|nr:NAD(P)/FAD-dependent oxidoreductase [Candidatus Colimorpha onthohippi]